MSCHTYKILEIVGSSTVSIDDAVRGAVQKAAETIRNIHWFKIVETRGHVDEGKVVHFQVTVKIGFTLD